MNPQMTHNDFHYALTSFINNLQHNKLLTLSELLWDLCRYGIQSYEFDGFSLTPEMVENINRFCYYENEKNALEGRKVFYGQYSTDFSFRRISNAFRLRQYKKYPLFYNDTYYFILTKEEKDTFLLFVFSDFVSYNQYLSVFRTMYKEKEE